MSREANRARFPELAQWTDITGGKLVWARDDQGELGKRPEPEFEMDGEAFARALRSGQEFGQRVLRASR